MDPLSSAVCSMDEIKNMCDELFEVNQTFLANINNKTFWFLKQFFPLVNTARGIFIYIRRTPPTFVPFGFAVGTNKQKFNALIFFCN